MKKYKWLIIDIFVISSILALTITLVAISQMTWKWIAILSILAYVLNTVFIVFTLINNDNQSEKLSWVFFMVCIPCIGLIFYCLFRVRRTVGEPIKKFDEKFAEFEINSFNSDQSKENKFSNVCQWQIDLVKRNFYGTNLKIYRNGFDAYEQLLEDIKNAKKYIHIEMYIIKISEIYEKLKNVLFQKVQEGVEVKIIIDKFGSWKVPIDEFKHLKAHGIELCFFNIPIYPYVRHTDNKRLHRKFFIIDGEVIHFGGLNISDEYCSYSQKYGYWADTNFIATGKIINDFESVFLYDWFKTKKEKLDKSKYIVNQDKSKNENAQILTFEDGPTKETNYLEDSIDYWINSTKKSFKIATPYFIPSEKILNSLKNAIRRGVEICIFVPGKPDKKFTYSGTLFFLNELVELGAKIYIYNETFLHSKFGIFDDSFAYIGTNNLDMRSFYTNQESINLVLGDKIIKELNTIFDDYEKHSIVLKFKKSKTRLFKQFLFRLTAPLM